MSLLCFTVSSPLHRVLGEAHHKSRFHRRVVPNVRPPQLVHLTPPLACAQRHRLVPATPLASHTLPTSLSDNVRDIEDPIPKIASGMLGPQRRQGRAGSRC
jgi:hypothetical protein